MSYFQASRPTKRITLPSNPRYWVEIFSSLKYKEQHALASTLKDGEVDGMAAADLMLRSMIAGWNLDDDAGQVVPVTPENIELLEKQDVEAILTALQSVASVDEDEKKSSLNPSSVTSQVPAK